MGQLMRHFDINEDYDLGCDKLRMAKLEMYFRVRDQILGEVGKMLGDSKIFGHLRNPQRYLILCLL
jgi:hypothetical protein